MAKTYFLKKINKTIEQITANSVIWLIVIVSFIARLYRINNPILDWHAFRQADTASVTHQYLINGINIFEPKYHDLSNIQSGKNNLDGYRMVEFPIINAFIAYIIQLFQIQTNNIDLTMRVFSVLASCVTIISLYYWVSNLANRQIANWTSIIFALHPFAIYYSRVVLPEPFLLMFINLSIYYYHQFLSKEKIKSLILGLIFFSFALLLKPFALMIALPLLALAIAKKPKIKIVTLVSVSICLSSIPLMLWRNWIQLFPTGIPASDWLWNGSAIRWKPAWWRWLFYERFIKIFLGYYSLIFFVPFFNFSRFSFSYFQKIKFWLKKSNQLIIVLISWWISAFMYLSIIATGNVTHDYYQVILLPLWCLTLASAIIFFQKNISSFRQKNLLIILLTLLILLLNLYQSWQIVGGFFNVNHWEYYEAGIKADTLLPKNAKVIAPAMGDTMFLYQTKRVGWPIGFNIEEKIKLGAEFYISVNFDDETNFLRQQYQTIYVDEKMIILNLREKII